MFSPFCSFVVWITITFSTILEVLQFVLFVFFHNCYYTPWNNYRGLDLRDLNGGYGHDHTNTFGHLQLLEQKCYTVKHHKFCLVWSSFFHYNTAIIPVSDCTTAALRDIAFVLLSQYSHSSKQQILPSGSSVGLYQWWETKNLQASTFCGIYFTSVSYENIFTSAVLNQFKQFKICITVILLQKCLNTTSWSKLFSNKMHLPVNNLIICIHVIKKCKA